MLVAFAAAVVVVVPILVPGTSAPFAVTSAVAVPVAPLAVSVNPSLLAAASLALSSLSVAALATAALILAAASRLFLRFAPLTSIAPAARARSLAVPAREVASSVALSAEDAAIVAASVSMCAMNSSYALWLRPCCL